MQLAMHKAQFAGARVAGARAVPNLPSARRSVRVAASAAGREEQIAKLLALPAAASTLLAAGNAHAATELAQIAGGDGRLSTIALLFLPALGWVGFNILGPLNNQLARMNELSIEGAPAKKRGIAGAVGLDAALSLFAAQQADAATEVAQLASSDGRLSTIALLFLPALGWVLFNIFGPLNNQLARMNELNADGTPKKKKRGVAGAVGLGAALSLAAAQQADAATEVAQLAGSDGRLSTIALLFLPALGWVLFNIFGPLNNQLARMNELNADGTPKKKKRGVAGAVGLGAALSLAAAQQADAATEVAQLAGSDGRLSTIALLFLPALGWVLFNIFGPLNNQLARMNELNSETAPKRR